MIRKICQNEILLYKWSSCRFYFVKKFVKIAALIFSFRGRHRFRKKKFAMPKRFCLAQKERGTTSIEYAIIAALISIGILVAFRMVSGSVQNLYLIISNAM